MNVSRFGTKLNGHGLQMDVQGLGHNFSSSLFQREVDSPLGEDGRVEDAGRKFKLRYGVIK